MGILLNVGSGQRPFQKPWINLDTQARWNPDVVCDCSRLPYDDEVVDLVVLHHVLEHFGCGEGSGLIAEANRVLEPGGSLLVFVPDMRALAQAWLIGKLDTQIYLTNLYGAYMGDPADRHRWGFTTESLTQEIHKASRWIDVRKFDWRPIAGADIAKDWWVLGMEAIK